VRSSEVKVGRPCNKRWRCCGVQARLLGLAGPGYSGLMSEISGPADMSQHVRFGHPGGETEAHVTPRIVSCHRTDCLQVADAQALENVAVNGRRQQSAQLLL